jgi:TolB-like protein
MDGDEISLGRFQFDVRRRELRLDGRPVQLGSRARDILSVLVAARGEVVTKDELMARVWPGVAVEENNIQVHVSALRKALDEGKDGPACLVTVPGRGYRLIGAQSSGTQPAPSVRDAKPGPALPDKPSIAVLPFQSLSDDPEQQYFADGVVDEIITALSRFAGLFVISRNSSFTYKGRSVDVKQVGSELGVRYVLEGTVPRGGSRVRITGQLIDASTGAHLWADRFEGASEDIFDLQDQVTTSVVAAIAPRLERAEIERARRKPTGSLDAYDYYLRGLEHHNQNTRESIGQAMRLYARAIELDPSFAAPYAGSAHCHVLRQASRWMTDRETEAGETAPAGPQGRPACTGRRRRAAHGRPCARLRRSRLRHRTAVRRSCRRAQSEPGLGMVLERLAAGLDRRSGHGDPALCTVQAAESRRSADTTVGVRKRVRPLLCRPP